jgi:hypothetical protein
MRPETMTLVVAKVGELRNRDTRVMIEKFAYACGSVLSEFPDLNQTSKNMALA